jgi:rhamnosyltransferase subunit B
MNVLIATTGTSGDVFPFLGLGRALRARGHSVTVLVNAHFEAHVRRAGLEFASVGEASAYRELTNSAFLGATGSDALRCFVASESEAESGPFGHFVRYVRREVRPAYEAIAARAERGRTVIVAHAFSGGALVAHEKLGVPLAIAHLAPSILASAHQPMGLANGNVRWLERTINRSAWQVTLRLLDRLAMPPIDALRAELALPGGPVFRRTPELLIGLFPEWFAPRLPDWPAQLVLSDFPRYEDDASFCEPARSEFARFIAQGAKPVVFTAGTGNSHAADFFRAGLDACARLGHRALVLTPHREHLPERLPAGSAQFPFVPLGEALASAQALVHHGGIGTCAQAFAAGVPQLIVPMSTIYDQTNNGLRVERLGAGLSLARTRFRGEAAVTALQTLLEAHQIQTSCQAIARMSGDAASRLRPAVEAIERALTTRASYTESGASS